MRVVVIGGGVAGLSTSIRLAHAGHEVKIIEKNDFLGGKLSEIRVGPYRFDAGPSLFTMPHFVEELLTIDGQQNVSFNYKRLSTICKYHWNDGVELVAPANRTDFIKMVAKTLGEREEGLARYMEQNEKKYLLTHKLFLESSIKDLRTWLSSEAFKAYASLHKLDIFSKMHDIHRRTFSNPKTVQLFDRYATYNGSNPFESSGIMTMISHLEYDIGAFFPDGGMYSIVQSLIAKARSLGVAIHLSESVSSIECNNNEVEAVVTNRNRYKADAVVSNLDNYYTYSALLGDETKAKKIAQQERSTSAIIFYLGINKSFPSLDLHNIFFSDDYAAEFDQMQKGDIVDDPTIYLNISCKKNKQDAPEGHENWFVMINVAAGCREDEELMVQQYRKIVLHKLSTILGVKLTDYIVAAEYISPSRLDVRTGAFQGALYGLSSNDRMAAFFRENNKSRKYKGLFFCGGTVHPGGGIPLCLLSGKITAKMIDEYIVS